MSCMSVTMKSICGTTKNLDGQRGPLRHETVVNHLPDRSPLGAEEPTPQRRGESGSDPLPISSRARGIAVGQNRVTLYYFHTVTTLARGLQ
jgi:hypothetical protein